MALTPLLNDVGRKASEYIAKNFEKDYKIADAVNFGATEPVVILGFGQMGQVLANFLSTPLASGGDGNAVGWPCVAFDLDLSIVKGATNLGFPVLYGDGSRPAVLQSAGISSPKAVMVMYSARERALEAVQRIRLAFPATPIYARAIDLEHLLDLKKAGATDAILENAETSLQLGSKLLKGLGVMSDDVSFLSQLVRDSMEQQAQSADRTVAKETEVMKSMQVRVGDLVDTRTLVQSFTAKDESRSVNQRDVSRIQTLPKEDNRLEYDDDSDQTEVGRGVLYCELDTDDNSPEP